MRTCLLLVFATLVQAQPVEQPSPAGRSAVFQQLPQHKAFGPWRPLGPTSYGGKVYDLAVDARNEQLIYAAFGAGGEIGSENGSGLWMTRDGGETWHRAIDWMENSAFLSVRAHPNIAGYVAAGLRAVDYNKARGVMLSKDGGTTWINVGPPSPNQHIWDIAFDPQDAARIYVATQFGLWVTRDSGETWQQLLTYTPVGGEFFDDAASLALSPSGTVLILASRGAGVQRSADGGKTWVRVDASWGGPKEPISVLAWAPGDEHVVYAERVSGRLDKWGTSVDLLTYRSSDGGLTWLPGAVIPGRHQGRMDMSLAVDPRNSNKVIAGNIEIHLSDDGLRSLTSPDTKPHDDHLRIAFSPSNPDLIYSGNDGGVWKSTNLGKNWIRIDSGILTTHAWALAVSGERIYMSPGDYEMLTFHPKTGWHGTCGGEFERVYAASDGAIYGMRRVYPGSGRMYRLDSLTEPCIDLGPKTNEKLASAMPVAFAAQDAAKIFVGLEQVWRSPDRGRTWRKIGPKTTGGRILALSVSPLDDRTLTALSEDGQLWLTTNDGATWRQGARSNQSQTTVFAGVGRNLLIVGGSDGLFKSTDAGLTLHRLAGFPSALTVKRLLADPAQPKRIFAATDAGVVISDDTGESWKRLDWGRPPGSATEIVSANGVLYSTSSQGVWALPLGEPRGCDLIPTVAPKDPVVLGSSGGETRIEVYAQDGCDWNTEVAGADWIRLRKTSHGVTIRVAPNLQQAERQAKLTIAGESFEVRQFGGADPVASEAALQIKHEDQCLVLGTDKWREFRRFQFRRCPVDPEFKLWQSRDLVYKLRLRENLRFCADATGQIAGRPLVVHPCFEVDHQAFQFVPGPGGLHQIRVGFSGLCLTRSGDEVSSELCSDQAAQWFHLN